MYLKHRKEMEDSGVDVGELPARSPLALDAAVKEGGC